MANYIPNEQDFSEWDKEVENNSQSDKLDKLSKENPFLFKLSKKISENPGVKKVVDKLANNPITEAGVSASLGFNNAFGNMVNAAPFSINLKEDGLPDIQPRDLDSPPLHKRLERPGPEPTDPWGKAGSLIGDIAGAGTALAVVPGSLTLPGGLATGALQSEGGFFTRLRDSLIGAIIPGIQHAKKGIGTFKEAKKIKENLGNLEKEETQVGRNVFKEKSNLASAINKESENVAQGKESFESALKKAAGNSESESKSLVSSELKNTEKHITEKYHNLYEGFNNSSAGKTLVKDPVNIKNLEKEFDLTPKDFSKDTKKLINHLIGEEVEVAPSSIISSVTKKPAIEAHTLLKEGKPPKVSEYINLWKQTRAEVADLKHAERLATTPEAKRAFREKRTKLEKFSDSINEKTMSSLPKDQVEAYKKIQRGYLNERVPFLEEPLLKRATDKHGKVSDNFFSKLNKLGNPEFIETIKKEYPKLSEAITKHDIRDLSNLSVDKLKSLLESDFGRFVSKDIKDSLIGLVKNKTKEDLLQKAFGKVQSTEIGRLTHSREINKIMNQNPSLAKPFKSVADEQEKLRKLKDALTDEGLKLKEINEALKKYKTAFSAAKSVAAPVGTYLGIKKTQNRYNSDYSSR